MTPDRCEHCHAYVVMGANCPNGCDVQVPGPRVRSAQPEPLRVEETFTARRQRQAMQARNVRRYRRRPR